MNIVILEGSPDKNGSSNMLAKEFSRRVKEIGHNVQMIDVAHANVNPCIGCIRCGYESPCVQKDDVNEIRQVRCLLISAIIRSLWTACRRR